MDIIVSLIVIIAFICFIALIIWLVIQGGVSYEPPEKQAGKMGEQIATNVICEVLRKEDKLFTNVPVYADGKQTELDNVIVNENGVFIIEVKNFSGVIRGEEDDYEWTKFHTSSGGNTYVKTIKNPIHQVKREIHILSTLLKDNNIKVWIEGYVFFVQMNSPVESPNVLRTRRDIDNAIHKPAARKLSEQTQQQIIALLRR